MNAKQIETLVKSGAKMPENLDLGECYYFLSLDYIRKTRLTREDRERRYRIAHRSFELYRHQIFLYQNTCEMRVKLACIAKEMTVHGCPLCKKAIAIFDGRNIEGVS